MKNFITLLSFLVLLFLAGCGDPEREVIAVGQERICKTNGQPRSCTARENMMIDDMRAIINGIKNYRDQPESFLGGMENSLAPKVYFCGEIHNDIIGKIETLGKINATVEPGDKLLLEGGDRRYRCRCDCALKLVYNIFLQWQWEKTGRSYAADGAMRLAEEENFQQLLQNTRSSYDLRGLKLHKLSWGYWDDARALAKGVSYKTLKERNKAMVEAIDESLRKTNGKVILIAGLAHLPSGDWYIGRAYNQGNDRFPMDLGSYFHAVKSQRKVVQSSRLFKLDEASGSCRPIYNYLKLNNIPFAEYIHKKMLH